METSVNNKCKAFTSLEQSRKLAEILPLESKKETTTLSRGGWKIEPIEYLDNWWCEYEDESHTKNFTVSADNPIDACYDMIIKLYELKML